MKNIYTLIFLALFFPGFSQTVTHGPIIGGVTDTSCRIFIRTDISTQVTIELSTSSSFGSIATSATITTDATRDTVAISQLNGLAADTRYYVRATISGTQSGAGSSFRTFPQAGTATHQIFTSGSCHYDIESPDSSLYVRMAMDSPRAFIQCGDWGYPDADSGTINIYLNNPSTSFAAHIENHRTFYKKRYSCLGSYTFLHNFPVDYVYDDHDYLNDNSADDAVSGFDLNLLSLGAPKVYHMPPIARLNSIEAYQEWFPSYPLVDSTQGIYHSFRSGNVEFFIPDLRAMRTAQAAAIRKSGSLWMHLPPAGYSLTGAQQLAWLRNALANSTATWKVIISSVPFNHALQKTYDSCLIIGNGSIPYWAPAISGINLPNYGYTAVQNYADSWAGYKEDADSLLQFVLQNNIKNVFVVSGDSHTVGLDDGENSGLPELNCGILRKANSRDWMINQAFTGTNIWNKGGSGLCDGTNFESAYSRIEAFGDDSLRLSAIDASGFEIAGWTFHVNESYKFNPAHRTNHLPVAADDVANINPGDTAIVYVTDNDSDADHDSLYVNLRTTPAHGTAITHTDNTISYIPDQGYAGTDTFRYMVCDHTNASCPNCATALVTVSISTGITDRPAATITVYPNPAQDILYIHSSDSRGMDVEMINILGAQVLHRYMDGHGTLDISSLAAGHYYVNINAGGTVSRTNVAVVK
ncbi:MAG: hypothetical protein JWO03_2652 [Bacteroidetes bacterium]|nr:hypothetical protein [Bacteroidota bacterium]